MSLSGNEQVWMHVMNFVTVAKRKRKPALGAFQHHGMLMGSNLGKRPHTSSMLHPDLSLVQNRAFCPGTAPPQTRGFLKNQTMPCENANCVVVLVSFLLSVLKPSSSHPPPHWPAYLFLCHRPMVEFKEAHLPDAHFLLSPQCYSLS